MRPDASRTHGREEDSRAAASSRAGALGLRLTCGPPFPRIPPTALFPVTSTLTPFEEARAMNTTQKALAEFIGTLALIFIGAGSICAAQLPHGAAGGGGGATAHGP